MKFLRQLGIVLTTTFFLTNLSTAQVNTGDSLALIDIYSNLGGLGWNNSNQWLTGPVSSWYGVTVDAGRVTEIDLAYNNLKGILPASIGDLDSLKVLMLRGDSIHGSIPSGFWTLENLEVINFRFNHIHDSLPPAIQNLAKLEQLLLESNDFFGPVPPEIGQLSKLWSLNIESNSFNTLPDEIGNLTDLAYLNIRGNGFTGPFPDTIFHLTSLTELRANGNNFSGTISPRFSELTQLVDLQLNNNQFIGNIPIAITQLNLLMQLYIGDNNLSGIFPDELWRMPNLRAFEANGWNHGGFALSDSIGNAANLVTLNLDYCDIGGIGGAPIPVSILNLNALEELRISGNHIDSLPDLTQLPNLDELDISGNYLDFADLELLTGFSGSYFNINPQRKYGQYIETTINLDDSILLHAWTPGSANQYQWYFNTTLIPGATDSLLNVVMSNALLAGTYTCKVNSSLVPGLTMERQDILLHTNVGIESSAERGSTLQLYPNPVLSGSNISCLIEGGKINWIIISDMQGKCVYQLFHETQNSGLLQISTFDFPAGLYLLKLDIDGKIATGRFVVAEQ